MNASLFPKLLKKHYLLPLARQLSRRPQVPSPSMKTIAMNELRSTTRNLHQQQNLKEKNGRIRSVLCPTVITTPAVGDIQRHPSLQSSFHRRRGWYPARKASQNKSVLTIFPFITLRFKVMSEYLLYLELEREQ